ncbi:MAG: hypothetical protein ABTA16_05155 [Niallia sp.]
MKKLDEIKAFIQKNAKVMAEFAQAGQYSSLFSSSLSDEIIEQQQELKRHARHIGVIAVDKPFFDETEFQVLLRFDEFCSFINLEEFKKSVHEFDHEVRYFYSFIIANLELKSLKIITHEEHKKAQEI